MEPMGAMSEGEWNTFSGMFSPEEADFMAQLLSNCSLPNELSPPGHGSTMNLAGIQEGDSINPNMYSFLQESSYSGGNSLIFPTSSHESYYLQQQSDSHQFLSMNNSSMSSDFCTGEDQNTSLPVEVFMTNNPMEGDDCLKQEISNGSMEEAGGNLPEAFLHGKNLQIGRKPEMPVPETSAEDENNSPPENSKKRNRVSGEVQRKRNVKPKKNQKIDSTSNIDEKSKTGLHRQTSSSDCSEEDESNASPELNGGVTSSSSSKGAATLSLNGKTRASRGSATDPQSLYARKRRERINERLRILQNLVPNGTKVDISSMLEEAVQYVKFLQLQIKLLSSDDLWMYAPIAYNGMDIGLDLKIAMHR